MEKEDIADLEEVLARPSGEPVERTFSALLAGSENCLQAFTTMRAHAKATGAREADASGAPRIHGGDGPLAYQAAGRMMPSITLLSEGRLS